MSLISTQAESEEFPNFPFSQKPQCNYNEIFEYFGDQQGSFNPFSMIFFREKKEKKSISKMVKKKQKMKQSFLPPQNTLKKLTNEDDNLVLSEKKEEKDAKKNQKEGNKKKLYLRKGDWKCLSCYNINFSFRKYCNRCLLPKSLMN